MTRTTYEATVKDGRVQLPDDVTLPEDAKVYVVIAEGDGVPSDVTFERYLRTMPDVGTDADFSRMDGSIREIDLSD